MEEKDYKIDHIVKAKSEDPLFHLHEYDIDVQSRHIYLMGIDRGYEQITDPGEPGVDYTMANRFIRNLNICMRFSKEPIVIHMKTCGGDWVEGMAIYDAIRACPNPVTILSYSHARSMSSIILQAADKRVLMPNSYFMYHDGTLAFEGTFKQVYSEASFHRAAKETMLDIYAREMQQEGEFKGASLKAIKAYLVQEMDKKEDVYLTARQAVKLGLADEIFNYNWANLTVYKK
jgi:ATP-dependent protease ClpP protease subunit